MKNLRILTGVASTLLILLACKATGGASAPTLVPSQTPAGLNQPSPAPTSQPVSTPTLSAIYGKPVSIGGVSFLMVNPVASEVSSSTTTELELPFVNGPADLPQHSVLTLDNYGVQGSKITPKIIVFRAAEYAQYSELITSFLEALKNPYVDGQPLPQVFGDHNPIQVHGLSFKNGHGFRLLKQINQAPTQMNNAELFYYFRGLTDDGQYYIQAELPVQSPYLPANSNLDAPLPPEGVPFNLDDPAGYLKLIVQKLNAAASGSFTPTLEQLDALIESLEVRGL